MLLHLQKEKKGTQISILISCQRHCCLWSQQNQVYKELWMAPFDSLINLKNSVKKGKQQTLYAPFSILVKVWKQSKMSTNREWLNKLQYVNWKEYYEVIKMVIRKIM